MEREDGGDTWISYERNREKLDVVCVGGDVRNKMY